MTDSSPIKSNTPDPSSPTPNVRKCPVLSGPTDARPKTDLSTGPTATYDQTSSGTDRTLAPPPLLQYCATRDDLHYWIKHHLGLAIPTQAVCPDHTAPFEYLWDAYHEPAKDLIVWAPRGGGKTTLGAIATLLDVLHKPACNVRILGGSLEQSLRMWEQLNPMIQQVADDLLEGKDRARRLTLKNGATAAVLTQSQRAVRGLRVQKLRCDEVELFKPDIWEAAQLSTRSKSAGDITLPDGCAQEKVGITASIEALSTLHEPFGLMQSIITAAEARSARIIKWCLLDVLEQCPPERQCEACALDPECQGRARTAHGFFKIDDALTMKHRVSRQTWESEMLCLRPSRTSGVFTEFNPDIHVRATPPWGDNWPGRNGAWGCGIDFGFTNPFVCLWVQFDPLGYCFVVDEYVQTRRIMASHILELKSRPYPLPRFMGVDPSGKQVNGQTAVSYINLLRNTGYEVRERQVLIRDGLEVLHAALAPAIGEPTLYIHPRCQTLIKSMTNYRYAHPSDETPLKDKVNDHAVDALRYFLTNRTAGETQNGRY